MSDTSSAPIAQEQVDSVKEFGSVAARWQAELRACEKERKDWLYRCEQIEKRYREDKEGNDFYQKDRTRFNVLWSNVQTLLPAVYSRPPVPVVTRRFRDQDKVARAASVVLQRTLSYVIDHTELHSLTRESVLDWLLYARGTLWVRYEPHGSTADMPGIMEPNAAQDGGAQITSTGDDQGEHQEQEWEEVEWDFVHREDFFHGPARVWQDVSWVARRVRMTQDAGVKRFGAKFKKVNMSWMPKHANDVDQSDTVIRRAEVVEIWNMDDRKVTWIGDPFGDAVLLDELPDIFQLEGFFPCPRPLFGTMTSTSLIPVPDYVEYQDQAKELDDLTARISALTQSIKIAGAYNSRFPELSRIFEEGLENQLVPIETWDEFAAKNGLDGAIDLVDLSPLAGALTTLTAARQQVKSDLYEISGIADVIRGSTAPEETATAQRIKGRYATMRLSDRQLEVARFVRDILRITGEIICEHFSPQTLRLISNFDRTELAQDSAADVPPMMGHNGGPTMMAQPGVPPMGMPPGMGGMMAGPGAMPPAMGMMPPPPPSIFDQAVALLKNDKLRGFRIDIEDQSTIAMDDEMEKRGRVEFLKAVGDYIQSAAQIPPNMAPAMLPLLGKMLLFGARAFRAGVEMETAIEDAIGKLTQTAQQAAANPQPDPKMIEAQAKAKQMEADTQARMMEAQASQQRAQAEIMQRQQQAQMQAQQAEADRALKMQEMQHAAAQAAAQNAQDTTQHQIAIDKAMLERERFQHEQERADREHQIAIERLRLDRERLDLDRRNMAVQAMQKAEAMDAAKESAEAED